MRLVARCFRTAVLGLALVLVWPPAVAGDEIEHPADWPEDLPVYPGAKLVSRTGDFSDGYILDYESSDAPSKIEDFYRESLVKNGWEIEVERRIDDRLALFANKDKREVNIDVFQADLMITPIRVILITESAAEENDENRE